MKDFGPLPMDWALCQWGGSELGDKRRTSRAVQVGASILSRSNSSLPKQMGSLAELAGAYRLLEMSSVTHTSLMTPHWETTLSFARSPDLGVVLFIQDGTELDFSTHKDTEGLGYIGNGKGYGMELHTALCVIATSEAEAEVVGLAHQTAWTRGSAPRTQKERDCERRKRRTEYDVWKETVEAMGPAPDSSSGTSWVSVGDRASDIFSYMSRAGELGWHCLVRSKYNRVLPDSEDEESTGLHHLHERVRVLPSVATSQIHLRARPGAAARDVSLNVAFMPVTLPRTRRAKGKEALAMYCIRVWEESLPGADSKPLEWILLTSLPVENVEQALTVISYYRHRWLIEEYHKCLKTGCRIEKSQVATKDRLLAHLGFLGLVAVYLLQFKAPRKGRTPPKELVAALKAVTGAKEDLNDLSLFCRRLAMLGGFLGRKGDGSPGWQSIWEGWKRLQDIILGMHVAQGTRCV